ncbi:MAG: DUF4912 domain-containing protein [Planctomycetota bacterium]
MISATSLKSYSMRDLTQLAKKRGISGWQSMRKDQLVRSLGRAAGSSAASGAATGGRAAAVAKRSASSPARKSPAKATAKPARPAAPRPAARGAASKVTKSVAKPGLKSTHKPAPVKASSAKGTAAKPVESKKSSKVPKSAPIPKTKPRSALMLKKIQKANEQRERQRDLATEPRPAVQGKAQAPVRVRVVLIVRDPYWLQVSWEVTRQSVLRAQAAMAEQWHSARPTLRVLEVENSGTTSTAERVIREIAIHSGVQNWYIDVTNPPKSYRVDLGYLSGNGRFYAIGRSNTVTTQRPGTGESLDDNWTDVAENFEKIFAQSGGYSDESSSHELQEAFEERFQRPLGAPLTGRFGAGAERVFRRRRDFPFEVDAEMVVFGRTQSDAHVSLSGEPVKLRSDGTFSVRMPLPDRRQVIPVVASSRDGVEQRTIVIAVERNTKSMEPMSREQSE